MTCVFCDIVKDVEPSRKIAQSAHFMAVLDTAPLAEGDTILLAKEHLPNILELPDELGTEFLQFIKRVANTMMIVTKAEGFNLVANNGAAAGQQEFHAHLHIIPRKANDKLQVNIGAHRVVADKDLVKQKDEFIKSYDDYPATAITPHAKNEGRFATPVRRFH